MICDEHTPENGMENKPSAGASMPRLILCRLAASRYSVPGHGWVARTLWRLTPAPCSSGRAFLCTYALGLEGLGYRRLLVVGSDGETAQRLYTLLARHTVTPCALRDVLEELVDLPGR